MFFFHWTKTKIGSPLLDKRRHFENKFRDHVIDIFTSEDMENISLCIFHYLTVYYIINMYTTLIQASSWTGFLNPQKFEDFGWYELEVYVKKQFKRHVYWIKCIKCISMYVSVYQHIFIQYNTDMCDNLRCCK
jgi:hypothetical protein